MIAVAVTSLGRWSNTLLEDARTHFLFFSSCLTHPWFRPGCGVYYLFYTTLYVFTLHYVFWNVPHVSVKILSLKLWYCVRLLKGLMLMKRGEKMMIAAVVTSLEQWSVTTSGWVKKDRMKSLASARCSFSKKGLCSALRESAGRAYGSPPFSCCKPGFIVTLRRGRVVFYMCSWFHSLGL